MKEIEIAKWLDAGSKSKVNQVAGRTRTYTGVALEDSADGKVHVDLGGDVVSAEGEQGIEVPCGPQVKEGDRVVITTVNGSPYVSSVDGWGDYVGGQASFSYAYIGDLTANNITTDMITATTGYIDDLTTNNITTDMITASTGYIDDLTANNITTDVIAATTGYIDDLTASNITSEEIIADHASIENLDTNYAHISNGVIDNATIGYADVDQLDANYAKINLENVNNSWITNGVIKNAAITDAQIIGVSANKLTAGTIDASKINVTNLNTDNLQVKKINGQPVLGGYLAVDSSASGYDQSDPSALGWYEIVNGNYVLSSDTTPSSNKAYYIHTASVALYDQTYINSMESDLNDRIDGAIETWTGSAVPTLNNYPASSWTTDDAKSSHVGDIYYVINASQSADGYCYRFAYDSTSDEFVWVLIKDSDVTAALSRLVTAEGKITGLETFETETSSWIDETDEGLTSIRTRTTNLETAVGNKVDTSTFNTLSNTVDSNTASITALSHTVDGYEDSQGVIHEGLVNTVNTVSQTATSNSSTISQLTTTLGTNSDGTTKTGDVVQRTTAVEQDLAGYKTTVSNTYATNTRVSQAETSIAQTATDVTTIINSMVTDSKNLIVYFPDPASKVDKLYNDKMKNSSGVVRWGQLYAVDGSSSSWAGAAPYVRNYASGATEAASRYFMFCPIQKNIFRPGDTIKIEGRIYNRDSAVTTAKVGIWFYSAFDQAAGTSTSVGNYISASISLPQNSAIDFDRVIEIPSNADFSNKYYYVIGIDLIDARRAELLSTSIAVRINNYDNVFTMVRQYNNGVLVCKSPNTIGALVNANGSFDTVEVSWSNGIPTAGDTLASFGYPIKLGVVNEVGDYEIINISDGLLRFMSHISDESSLHRYSEIIYKDNSYITGIMFNPVKNINGSFGAATLMYSKNTYRNDYAHVAVLGDRGSSGSYTSSTNYGFDLCVQGNDNGKTSIRAVESGYSSSAPTPSLYISSSKDIDIRSSENIDIVSSTSVNITATNSINVAGVMKSNNKYVAIKNGYTHGTTPSSTMYVQVTEAQDTNGSVFGHDEYVLYNDQRIGHRFAAVAQVVNGTKTWYQSTMNVDVSGEVTYSIAGASNFRSAIGAFSTGGGTINGSISLNHSSIDLDESDNNVSSDTTRILVCRDSSNSDYYAMLQGVAQPSGATRINLRARNKKSNGTFVDNNLYLDVAKDGTRSVSVSDSAIWRTALGVPASSALTKSAPSAADNITFQSGYSLQSGDIYKVGSLMVSIRLGIKTTNAMASGTDYTVCTLASGLRPHANMYLTASDQKFCNSWITNNGAIHIKPTAAVSANSTIFFSGTWVISS